jgi:hypothetical protein
MSSHCSELPAGRDAGKPRQCPFSGRLRHDTTGLARLKSDPKIALRNKGLMNANYDVLETKSDIDWF